MFETHDKSDRRLILSTKLFTICRGVLRRHKDRTTVVPQVTTSRGTSLRRTSTHSYLCERTLHTGGGSRLIDEPSDGHTWLKMSARSAFAVQSKVKAVASGAIGPFHRPVSAKWVLRVAYACCRSGKSALSHHASY